MVSPVLTIWVIYWSPRDYQGKYVTRAQDALSGNPEPVSRQECTVHDSLEAARGAVPPNLYRMERHPQDESTIVETWI